MGAVTGTNFNSTDTTTWTTSSVAFSNLGNIELIVTGTAAELQDIIKNCNSIHYKEHPFARHYKGIKTERDWIFPDLEADGSFFKYWNKGIKQLNY